MVYFLKRIENIISFSKSVNHFFNLRIYCFKNKTVIFITLWSMTTSLFRCFQVDQHFGQRSSKIQQKFSKRKSKCGEVLIRTPSDVTELYISIDFETTINRWKALLKSSFTVLFCFDAGGIFWSLRYKTVKLSRANVCVGPGIEPVTFRLQGGNDSDELPGHTNSMLTVELLVCIVAELLFHIVQTFLETLRL